MCLGRAVDGTVWLFLQVAEEGCIASNILQMAHKHRYALQVSYIYSHKYEGSSFLSAEGASRQQVSSARMWLVYKVMWGQARPNPPATPTKQDPWKHLPG